MKLWKKDKVSIDKEVEEFIAGNDVLLDGKLVEFDCIASAAHAKMLHSIGVLSGEELGDLEKCLEEIIGLSKKGEFGISFEDEDCHTKIENYLVEKVGVAGKKIHTGRSRNDQVIAAIRLFAKNELNEIKSGLLGLAKIMAGFAKENEFVGMPGYTHMQKAMPSSWGLWGGAFAEALLDDLKMVGLAIEIIDQNPLGSAAGYGVNVPLDRELTKDLLGFGKIQNSALYVQNSRGKFELIVVNALLQVMLDLNKIATDLLLFSTEEFGFVEISPELCSGSSIMPQKKNADVLEMVRAKSGEMAGECFKIFSIINSLPSGYNKDFQLTKEPFMNSLESCKKSVSVMKKVISGLKVDKGKSEAAITPEMFQAVEANKLALGGVPFREAYKKAAESKGMDYKIGEYLKSLKIVGSPGNLNLDKIGREIQKLEN
ncbi:MAG: argininosuccinate lyase [Candidatus Diapherotrites archaeon]